MLKRCATGIIALFFISQSANAQIYAQGKNINDLTFFLQVELVEKPMEKDLFLAKIYFKGQRKDVDWYLKKGKGVEYKAFLNNNELINYMEDNGWLYLKKVRVKPRYSSVIKIRYLFRKSMSQLSEEETLEKAEDAQ